MAQSPEHILGKDEVPGSNPGISSRYKAPLHLFAVGCFFMFKESRYKAVPVGTALYFRYQKKKITAIAGFSIVVI